VIAIARCGCGGTCGCGLTGGTSGNANVTVTGAGSQANPYAINVNVPCSTVRTCLTAGTGITYDNTTGVISASGSGGGTVDCADVRACLSSGSGVAFDGAAGTISADAVTGCGITGKGTSASPLAANTQTWPYPCAIAANGGAVSCDPATGILYSDPLGHVDMQIMSFVRDYPNLAVPGPGIAIVSLDTFTASFTNPDTCRTMRAVIQRDADVNFDMPGTGTTGPSSAAYAIDGIVTYRTWNTGVPGAIDMHTRTGRQLDAGTVAPGGTVSVSVDIGGLSGQGGATYTQIAVSIRCMFVPTD